MAKAKKTNNKKRLRKNKLKLIKLLKNNDLVINNFKNLV
jgi:hypothetical protein